MNESRPNNIKSFIRNTDTISLMLLLIVCTFGVALCVLLVYSIPGSVWLDVAGPILSVIFFYILARLLKRWAR